MASRRVRALSLKKTKLGETDLIVTFLAEDGCQVRAVAKGARKPGSRFGGRVEPFVVVDLLLHEGRTLDIVTDAEMVASHAGVRTDYDRSSAASVVADFLDKVSVECQTEDRLFGLAVATIDAIEGAEPDALLPLVVAFLVKGIAMHGYRPQFSACVICGGVAEGAAAFSLESAGPVCQPCRAHAPDTVLVSADAQALLAGLLGARMAEVVVLDIPQPVLMEAFALVRRLVTYHVPARLKALDLYGASLGAAR